MTDEQAERLYNFHRSTPLDDASKEDFFFELARQERLDNVRTEISNILDAKSDSVDHGEVKRVR